MREIEKKQTSLKHTWWIKCYQKISDARDEKTNLAVLDELNVTKISDARDNKPRCTTNNLAVLDELNVTKR